MNFNRIDETMAELAYRTGWACEIINRETKHVEFEFTHHWLIWRITRTLAQIGIAPRLMGKYCLRHGMKTKSGQKALKEH